MSLADFKSGLSRYFPFLFPKTPRFVTETGAPVYGVMAEFATPADVYHAAERVRDAGYTKWDVYAPFPIHGIEDAMGVRRTNLSVLVAAGAFTGAGLGYLMQWWMSGNYALVVQGKPPTAWEPFIPITFELGVLAAAFTALFGMLMRNGLPMYYHPLFQHERFLRSSQDKFFIAVEADDPKFEPLAVRGLLQNAGAAAVELVKD